MTPSVRDGVTSRVARRGGPPQGNSEISAAQHTAASGRVDPAGHLEILCNLKVVPLPAKPSSHACPARGSTTETLANEVYFSPRQSTKRVSVTFGRPPLVYLTGCRDCWRRPTYTPAAAERRECRRTPRKQMPELMRQSRWDMRGEPGDHCALPSVGVRVPRERMTGLEDLQRNKARQRVSECL